MTLWNVAIIAVALLATGGLWLSANHVQAKGDLDRELMRELDRVTHGPPPPRKRGEDRGFGPGPDGPGPGGPGAGGDVLGLRMRPEEFAPDEEADAIASIRRPRFFDDKGKALNGGRDVPLDAEAAAKRRYGLSTVQVEGRRVRVATGPYGEGGLVQLGRDTDDFDRLAQAQVKTLGLVLPVALVIAAGGALLLTLQVIRPLRRTTDAVQRLSLTDLRERLPVTSADEFGELAVAFNAMVSRIERAHEAEQRAFAQMAAALDQQRQFTADVSHELRTPLTRIRLSAGREDAAMVVQDATAQMSRMVDQLLTLARADAGELPLHREALDLRVVVAEALGQVEVGERDVRIEAPNQPVPVTADADYLRRVITNLSENAVRHTAEKGRLIWRIAAGNPAVFELEDSGSGIPAEHLAHIWDRFYRPDEARHRGQGGAGLGLAIVKSLVEAHGGTVAMASQVGRGTRVRISLPN
jgi:signal transduction histidine kinase